MSSVNTKSQDKGAAESTPKLPDVIDPTVAADSLREHTATLVKAFRHCLSSLADSLYGQSIIPEDAHRKAQREPLDEDERSRALVSCVKARLEIKPSDFKKFINILNSEPFFDTLGDKLVQSYCTLSSVPTTKCPNISPAVSQYAAYLKGVYRNSPISPDSKWPPTPSKKYIKLATAEYGYKCQDEVIGDTLCGNIEEVLESRKEISIDEILVPDKKGVAYLKLVLIEGAPGIGKSTLAWELCRRWEQGYMEKYSLTVLLRLREKEVQEIRRISQLFFSCEGEVLKMDISSSNGKGVLFILDGFDELPTTLQKKGFLVNLIKGILLPECTVLVTSRPSATAELLTICRPQLQKRIEVLGFTQDSVEEYATSIFSSEPETLQRFNAFISASKNPAINSLMYVPLYAAIIVEIYRNSKSHHLLPHTLTQLYTQLCLTILERYLQNNSLSVKVNKFKDLPGHLYQEFLKLSEVAFDGMKRQEVIFNTLPLDLIHFGFLDADSPLYGGGSVSYNFLHFTLQEFFAAYHISQLCGDAKLEVLREHGCDYHWKVVWRFVAGLTEFKFFEGHLNSKPFVFGIKENEVEVNSFFVLCLFEANVKMVCSKLFGLKNTTTVTIRPCMSPLDLYALGYCIANLTSEVFWSLDMKITSSMHFLISGLKTSNVDNGNISRLHMRVTILTYLRYATEDINYPYLKHFPLRGITDLSLEYISLFSPDHLTTLLSSMTSLKRLNISGSTFPDFQHINEFLQQLSQTNVTSLKIDNVIECVSALQPFIDPLTGTLEELSVCNHTDYKPDDDDTSLLDMLCSRSSLKSLSLINPKNTSSLTKLQTNSCLTKLEIRYCLYIHDIKYTFHPQTAEAILLILQCNATLKHLTVGDFKVPTDIDVLRNIVDVISRNNTLKNITLIGNFFESNKPSFGDPRIEWIRKKY